MKLRTDLRISLPSVLEDDKLETIHVGKNNQYEDEDGFTYVDERGEEQRLACVLLDALWSMSKGQKLLIEEKDDGDHSQHTGRIWQVRVQLHNVTY